MININYVSVQDSNATPTGEFFAIDSTNAGNNTGWTFLTSVNGSATLSGNGSVSIVYNPNVWTDTVVEENTWNEVIG